MKACCNTWACPLEHEKRIPWRSRLMTVLHALRIEKYTCLPRRKSTINVVYVVVDTICVQSLLNDLRRSHSMSICTTRKRQMCSKVLQYAKGADLSHKLPERWKLEKSKAGSSLGSASKLAWQSTLAPTAKTSFPCLSPVACKNIGASCR